MLPLSLLAGATGAMSGGNDSGPLTGGTATQSGTGFSVSHNINADGTGWNPGTGTIIIYILLGLLGVFIVWKLLKRR